MTAHAPGRATPATRPALVLETIRRALVGLLIAGALAGCGREDTTAAGGLTPEEFTDVIVELREAEREALEADSTAEVFARRKAEILERYDTSEEEIRAFLADPALDLPMLTELWDEISTRLRRPVPADSL